VGHELDIGFACPGFVFGQGEWGIGCGFAVWVVPVDFYIGDYHFSFLAGGPGGFGFRSGVELGSPFIRIGRGTSPVALAVRGILDGVGQSVNCPLTCNHSGTALGVDLGIGVEGSFALGRFLSIKVKMHGGGFMGGFSGDYDGFLGGPFFRLLAGARL
jgi:hypothetical protein